MLCAWLRGRRRLGRGLAAFREAEGAGPRGVVRVRRLGGSRGVPACPALAGATPPSSK